MRILILRNRPNLKINLDAFALAETDPSTYKIEHYDNAHEREHIPNTPSAF